MLWILNSWIPFELKKFNSISLHIFFSTSEDHLPDGEVPPLISLHCTTVLQNKIAWCAGEEPVLLTREWYMDLREDRFDVKETKVIKHPAPVVKRLQES